MDIAGQAAYDAESLLALTWPKDYVPDPVVIARRLGAQVLEAPLDSSIACALVKDLGRDPIILLNDKDSRGRQRFNCAHCLGHLYQWGANDEFFHVDRRRDIFAPVKELGEAYADHFACALLMPAIELIRLKERYDMNALVAAKLGTTPESVLLRLQQIERALA